jgi:anti-sigma factor ChrR (cupin superfamily)
MSKHPSEANLALLAGGELRGWRRWNVARHVAGCAECRREVAEFSSVREEVRVMAEMPEVSWSSLAAEMRANIRVGLEAGE